MHASHRFLQDLGIDHLEVNTDNDINLLGRHRSGATCSDEWCEIVAIVIAVISLIIAAWRAYIWYKNYQLRKKEKTSERRTSNTWAQDAAAVAVTPQPVVQQSG